MAGAAYTTQSFKCSSCDTIFADSISLTPNSEHCNQHCNQPGLPLVATGARHVRTVTFARMPVGIFFRETDRDFEGSSMCQVAGGLNI
jgi:hypothetical protein